MTTRLSLVHALSLAAALGLACLPPTAAFAQDAPGAVPSASSAVSPGGDVKSAEEKALEQQLSADEPLAGGRVSIEAGHVDLGPKFVNGKWQLMVHDDTAASPVWRALSDVVLVGKDAAKLPVPDDERYSFVEAEPGSEVYVIPQTEAEGVVWPGWNTQDPQVVEALGRGVTLTLEGVEGPGQMTVYLENGNFSAPLVLWNSAKGELQDIWVEPNTHTHANWVFTAPGAYFVTVTASAVLADGSEVSSTQRIQFAVGSEVDPSDVFAQAETLEPVESAGESLAGDEAGGGASDDSGSATYGGGVMAEESGGLAPGLVVGIVVLLALVGGGVAFAVGRAGAAQKRAQERLK